MKSQAIIISAYIASLLIALTLLVLFTQIYPHTGGLRLEIYGQDIYRILSQRPYWDARDLAWEIKARTGAVLVRVNITAYDLITGRVVKTDHYAIEPANINLAEVYVKKYHYARTSRDAVLYTYVVEVGYR
ncbi:MAG: hypothetical protein DRO13_02625 [Thermoprotei archaeon]|nr:MAG: hypothetical protein DRO13_02625 [Thermoprotei archaeon]